MSQSIITKSKLHDVQHVCSNKYHFFNVRSHSKKIYTVSVKVNCDCNFMGIKGNPNSEVCSHIIAVLTKIAEQGGIPKMQGISCESGRNCEDCPDKDKCIKTEQEAEA